MLAGVRFIIAAGIAITAVGPAYGQRHFGGAGRGGGGTSQVPRYQPQSPTVSPYLNLLNRNGGSPATNYYGLVRPLQRQQAFNEQQAQTSAYQQQEIRDQQQAFAQPTIKPTGTAAWFQNMGQVSPYQVSGHYYGQWSTRTGRRGR